MHSIKRTEEMPLEMQLFNSAVSELLYQAVNEGIRDHEFYLIGRDTSALFGEDHPVQWIPLGICTSAHLLSQLRGCEDVFLHAANRELLPRLKSNREVILNSLYFGVSDELGHLQQARRTFSPILRYGRHVLPTLHSPLPRATFISIETSQTVRRLVQALDDGLSPSVGRVEILLLSSLQRPEQAVQKPAHLVRQAEPLQPFRSVVLPIIPQVGIAGSNGEIHFPSAPQVGAPTRPSLTSGPTGPTPQFSVPDRPSPPTPPPPAMTCGCRGHAGLCESEKNSIAGKVLSVAEAKEMLSATRVLINSLNQFERAVRDVVRDLETP